MRQARVPAEARIAVVTESRALPDSEVRAQFCRVKPFGEITVGRRCCAAPILGQSGSSAPPCWTLDVLNIVRRITEAKRAVVLDCGGKRSACLLYTSSKH